MNLNEFIVTPSATFGMERCSIDKGIEVIAVDVDVRHPSDAVVAIVAVLEPFDVNVAVNNDVVAFLVVVQSVDLVAP